MIENEIFADPQINCVSHTAAFLDMAHENKAFHYCACIAVLRCPFQSCQREIYEHKCTYVIWFFTKEAFLFTGKKKTGK